VDGPRYSDQPEPSWYSGQGQTSPNPYDSGVHDRPFRLPDQRDGGYGVPPSYPTPDPVTSTGSHARPAPAAEPPAPAPAYSGKPARSLATEPQREVVYRAKRPLSSLAIALVTIVLMVPAVMLLIEATFGDGPLAPGGVVPSVLLTLGLPLTGLGMYTLAGTGPLTREAWLRPPLAYLPIGLLILVAAGLGAA
jgi:hypothetical protein